MTTPAIIAAAWLVCSVAVYFGLRHYHREMFGEWRRGDRWFCTAASIFGPASLPAAILAIAVATTENSERGKEILWRKEDQ